MTMPFAATLAPGRRGPFGAHAVAGGVNLAVWSEHATAIDWCLFDAAGAQELARHRLHRDADGVFHGFLAGAGPGLVYGLRAHGPNLPREGHRFNPAKLLLDPWAREIVGRFEWRPEHHGYVLGASPFDTVEASDNAVAALKARVAPPREPARRDRAPRHAPAARVLYELHVKSFSMRHPGLPPEVRGTYAALAHPVALAHFRRLGVTTLSLLPVQYRLNEPMMAPGLVNHWGYNTLGFFCPDPRFAQQPGDATAVADEFRAMVAALHAAGLEVLMDVVYNHTPEGNHFGPTLSFRGLDQKSWYRVAPDGPDRGTLVDFTHCGNTVNVAHPGVARFVVDSLAFWVREMGVDGFRFDLAPVLGRGADGAFSRDAAFFRMLQAEPALDGVALIAEAWDGGPRGYRVGGFPAPWQEWNDRFRDAARGFWLSQPGPHGPVTRREMLARLAGSPELYAGDGRPPTSSVNFIAVHDGYTLADLVAYARKHNHANGEDNRDGRDDELSANFGAEGPTTDTTIRATRAAVQRALLATLLLAQGTPMLLAGDEFGHSEQGNNNAWNQDNPLGWLGWDEADDALTAFVARVLALRGEGALGAPATWHEAPLRAFALDDDAPEALAVRAGGWLLALNPDAAPRPIPPEALEGAVWALALDTAAHTPTDVTTALAPRSLRLLRR
jgi:glycogen operon protein